MRKIGYHELSHNKQCRNDNKTSLLTFALIIKLLVFWSSFVLNNEVNSFHGGDCETGELGETFARNGGE